MYNSLKLLKNINQYGGNKKTLYLIIIIVVVLIIISIIFFIVNKQSVDKQSVDKQSVDKQSVDKQSVDKQSVDKQSVDKQSVDKQSVDDKYVIFKNEENKQKLINKFGLDIDKMNNKIPKKWSEWVFLYGYGKSTQELGQLFGSYFSEEFIEYDGKIPNWVIKIMVNNYYRSWYKLAYYCNEYSKKNKCNSTNICESKNNKCIINKVLNPPKVYYKPYDNILEDIGYNDKVKEINKYFKDNNIDPKKGSSNVYPINVPDCYNKSQSNCAWSDSKRYYNAPTPNCYWDQKANFCYYSPLNIDLSSTIDKIPKVSGDDKKRINNIN